MKRKYSVVCNSLNAIESATTTVNNNFFTSPTVTTNSYVQSTVPTGWSSTGGTGGIYQCNGTPFVNGTMPSGVTQYIMMQGATALYQDVTFPIAGEYILLYYGAPRCGLTSYNSQGLTITTSDSTLVNSQTFTAATTTTFILYTVNFTVTTSGVKRVTITTNAGVGDSSICMTGLTFYNYTTVDNPYFTSPTLSTNAFTASVPTNWTGVSSGGYSYHCQGTGFVNGALPNGINQYIGSRYGYSLYQDVTFPIAGWYKMSYYAAPRKGLTFYSTSQGLTITVGSSTVVNSQTFTAATTTTFVLYTVDFVVTTAGVNRVTFSTNTGGGTDTSICYTGLSFSLYNSSLTYKIDWSFLPMGQYKMTFTFNSNQTTTSSTSVILVMDDLGINNNNFSSGSKTSSITSGSVGYIKSNIFLTSLIANYKGNSPVYCRTPQNNIFSVKFYAYDATTLYLLSSEYILILNFEET